MKGIELKAARILFGLSQEEAAAEIGKVNQRSWAYWESGERSIPLDVEKQMRELMYRRNQTLEKVRALGKEAKQVAVLIYDKPQDAGQSLLEVRYNNALAATLYAELGVNLVKFAPQAYIDWLVDNGLIDSPQKRGEWASIQAACRKNT